MLGLQSGVHRSPDRFICLTLRHGRCTVCHMMTNNGIAYAVSQRDVKGKGCLLTSSGGSASFLRPGASHPFFLDPSHG